MKPQELKCKAAVLVQCLLYTEKSTYAICSYIYPAETLKKVQRTYQGKKGSDYSIRCYVESPNDGQVPIFNRDMYIAEKLPNLG